MTTILVLGGGPKAVAIAAKRSVLETLGWDVPEVVVLEQAEIAAHWHGRCAARA